MPEPAEANPIAVTVSDDAMSAELTVRSADDPSAITAEACIQALKGAGVAVSREVAELVADLLDGLGPGEQRSGVVATGTPPTDGEDGAVDWADRADGGEPTTVEQGQEVGRVREPTAGANGSTVRGDPIPARHGRPVALRIDDTIDRREDGSLIARAAGVLSRSLDRAAIHHVLELDHAVDGDADPIDFIGDVWIRVGARDGARIAASGNVTAGEVIADAEVDCGGDLDARGGVTGGRRARLVVRGDLRGGPFESTQIEVLGVLAPTGDLTRCRIVAHSGVSAPSGAIVGGIVTTGGPIEVARLGDPSGVPTVLEVGRVPMLEPKVSSFDRVMARLASERAAIDERLAGLAPEDRELGERLGAQRDELTRELERCEVARKRLERKIDDAEVVDIRVADTVHAQTSFVLDAHTYVVQQDLAGPVVIRRSPDHGLVYRVGDGAPFTPLKTVCELRAAV